MLYLFLIGIVGAKILGFKRRLIIRVPDRVPGIAGEWGDDPGCVRYLQGEMQQQPQQ